MFNQEKCNWICLEVDRLVKRHKNLKNDYEVHKAEWSLKECKANLSKQSEIEKELIQLYNDHKQFLFSQLNEASIKTLRKITDGILEVGA